MAFGVWTLSANSCECLQGHFEVMKYMCCKGPWVGCVRSGWELPNCAPTGLLLTPLRGDSQPRMNLTGSGHAQRDRQAQPVEAPDTTSSTRGCVLASEAGQRNRAASGKFVLRECTNIWGVKWRWRHRGRNRWDECSVRLGGKEMDWHRWSYWHGGLLSGKIC